MKNIFIITVCMLFGSTYYTHAQSQLIENMEWFAQSFTDKVTGDQSTGSFSFQTSSERLTMSNGQRTVTFTIISINGQWDDLEKNGQLICQIRSGEKSGAAIIGRNQGRLFINIDFSTHKDGMNRTFSINRYNRL